MKGHFFKNYHGITYRYHHNENGYDIAVRFDDNFAKFIGFHDLGEVLSQNGCAAFDDCLERWGKVPKYFYIRKDGQWCFFEPAF
ncbi:MAG TPA: hypothetical protein VHO50_07130 [Bacteroidales bacterium]|nr:hypothetical protein [Bacteroidales bacterium]